MCVRLRALGIFTISFLLGTMYAIFGALISSRLIPPLIAWPILIGLFCFGFWKFNLLRFAGFIAVLPVTVIGFEIIWQTKNTSLYADRYVALDRSHYTPNLRLAMSEVNTTEPDNYGFGLKEILISKDGFRADPDTGEGNPERCGFVLIGDSMIYGSGLAYSDTLGPVLASMGLRACVFGVTGNTPIDYLATLKYVAERIDPGAHVTFYLYAYNDFVSLNKYFRRGFLSLSNRFQMLFRWASYFDRWRRTTFTYSLFRAEPVRPSAMPWQYNIGKSGPTRLMYPRDPAKYVPPPPLNKRHLAALKFFFDSLAEFARGRSWQVSIVIHPDHPEIYANFARGSPAFVDLDPRRADGLKICKEFSFICDDISRYLYERSVADGKNPYFINDRHFSAFGTRIVAEHYLLLTKRAVKPSRAMDLYGRPMGE